MVRLGSFVCGECRLLFLASMHVRGEAARVCPFCHAHNDYAAEDKIHTMGTHGRATLSMPETLAKH